jgi:hypothetical protein
VNFTLKAMRLERWPRSTAILAGSAGLFFFDRAAFGRFDVPALAWRLASAFLLTWAISTSNYIINEIADAPFDVHHPTKRNRPLASGAVRKGPLILWGTLIGGLSLALARGVTGRETVVGFEGSCAPAFGSSSSLTLPYNGNVAIAGPAFQVTNTDAGGAWGVWAESTGTSGRAVYGVASAGMAARVLLRHHLGAPEKGDDLFGFTRIL